MKIFYLARFNTATDVASTRHVFEFCRQFARMGHQVTLFIPDLDSGRTLEGVRIVIVPAGRSSKLTFLTFYALLFFYLPVHFIKIRPQVVYTRPQQMEWLATGWKWLFRFLYVIEVNGLAPVELKMNSAPGWWIKVVEGMGWFCFRMPGLIVTSSAKLRDVLCDCFGSFVEKPGISPLTVFEYMLNHPDQMAEYGQNGLEAVRKVFNWETICRKIEAALEPSIVSK